MPPPAELSSPGQAPSSIFKLINPANKRKYNSSSWARASLAALPPPASGSSATTSSASAIRTAPAAPTPSPHRAASTPPRIITMTATAFTASSTNHRQGGDFPAPAKPTSTVFAQVSVNIIDQCVAQGVPFAREYGGLLDNRSFGGAQVSRTFYGPRPDRPAAPFSVPTRPSNARIGLGAVKMHPRMDMLDLIVVDGQARASSPAACTMARSKSTWPTP